MKLSLCKACGRYDYAIYYNEYAYYMGAFQGSVMNSLLFPFYL